MNTQDCPQCSLNHPICPVCADLYTVPDPNLRELTALAIKWRICISICMDCETILHWRVDKPTISHGLCEEHLAARRKALIA
jgi:hypothetical protein